MHRKHFDIAEILHRHGADIHVWGGLTFTPLHAATVDGRVDVAQFEVARMLLERRADVNARTQDGRSPLHIASYSFLIRDKLDIMQLLLEHGADANALDDEGSTPLHRSLYVPEEVTILIKPSLEVICLLLKHGANIDVENSKGKTAFQIASEKGYHEIV